MYLRHMIAAYIVYHLTQRELPLLYLEFARLQLGEVENIIDQVIHIPAAFLYHLHCIELILIGLLAYQLLYIAQYAIDGSAQLMRHIGHEFILDLGEIGIILLSLVVLTHYDLSAGYVSRYTDMPA